MFLELVQNLILNIALRYVKKIFFETCHASSKSLINLQFKSVSVGLKMYPHDLQVRSEIINVYLDETEELSAKTYLFHLSPSIVFHNLLNIPVTILLEVY